MKNLIGREIEKKELKEFIETEISKMAVVYGRRRIGKTFLIEHSVKGFNSFLFEGIENRSKQQQIEHFLFQLKSYFKDEVSVTKVSGWKEAFLLLYELIKDNPLNIVVFDEFQWMSNYREEIVSDLKFVWDQYYSRLSNTNIILCGSIASFMIKKVLKSTALYGRIDLEINLRPFNISETCELLQNRNQEECMDAFFFTGGVPKYLELLKPYSSIRLAIQELAFTRNGYFNREYDRIFISHFGKKKEYEHIIEILMQYPDGLFRSKIAEKLKIAPGGQLSEYLYNLEKAGFISVFIPYNKGLNTKYKKYFISDSYIKFFFTFILPNRKKIEAQIVNDIFIKITQTNKFNLWLGKSFELFCFNHAGIIVEKLGFSGIDFNYGPFFKTRNISKQEQGFQIDLLFDRQDNVISLCEIKYTNKKIGIDIIDEVEKKVELLETVSGKKTIQKILITKNEVTRELFNKAYFYKIIRLKDLISHL